MRAVRFIRNETAAMERCDSSDAVRDSSGSPERHGSAHTVPLSAHLAVLCDRRLLIQPANEGFRIGHLRVLIQGLGEGPHLIDRRGPTGLRGRCLFGAVEGIDYKDGIAGLGQALAHLPKRRSQSKDIRPYEYSRSCAAGGMHEI